MPHLDAGGLIQSVTFRLADSLPAEVVNRWKSACENAVLTEAEVRRRIACYEDAGRGECVLARAECAEVVVGTLLHFDGECYRLIEWCVMPNHVHAVFHCVKGWRLGDIVGSWKKFSARRINGLRGRAGPLWAPDYYDRYIRDPDHLADVRAYIRNNPVRAGLCMSPADWPWSSAAQ